MIRLKELAVDSMTDEQRALHHRILNGPRQAVRGPFPAWLRAPAFAERADALGLYLRFGSGLHRVVNEAATLVTAAHWGSAFVFRSHASLAAAAGLADPVIESIRCGHEPKGAAADVRMGCHFAREILVRKAVSDTTWTNAVKSLGEVGVVELIGLVGYYGIVCMTIKATQPSEDDGCFFAVGVA